MQRYYSTVESICKYEIFVISYKRLKYAHLLENMS